MWPSHILQQWVCLFNSNSFAGSTYSSEACTLLSALLVIVVIVLVVVCAVVFYAILTSCAGGRPPQYAPAPASWPLTFWPWKWCPSHVWRGLLCSNFSLLRPLCSRFRPDVRDRHTDVRRASSPNAPYPKGGGITRRECRLFFKIPPAGCYRSFWTKISTGVVICRKIRGQDQSGQAIKLFQSLRKISFTFHFWHESFIIYYVKLAELSNNGFEWKNVKRTLTPPTYFQDLDLRTNHDLRRHCSKSPSFLTPWPINGKWRLTASNLIWKKCSDKSLSVLLIFKLEEDRSDECFLK